MKKIHLYTLTFLMTLFSLESYSQIFMGNGSANTCSDFFFDNGGSGTGSPYGPNENFTQVICPGSGSFVTVNFFDFNLGAGDTLYVYDGSNTGAPLIGAFGNTVVSPGLIASNPNTNPTGCLTFVFVSDATNEGNGWAAEINCTPPCQNMYVQVDSIFPDTTGPDGEMDLCMGDTGYWDVSGWYTMNNTWYSQSDATTAYDWGVIQATGSFDTLLTGTGSLFTVPFDSSGAFIVYIKMTDTLGCNNSQPYQQIVRVSTPPSFAGSSMSSDTICYGLTNELTPVVNTSTWTNYIPPFSGDSVALPDGSGSSPGVYASTMNISTFPAGQTVTSLADIDNVFMNIEHSFIGDLSITLSCPNGSSVILKAFPGGGGNWLGIPCDNGAPNTIVGIPYLYEWPVQTAPALGTMNAVATGCAGCVGNTDICTGWGGNSLPQSTYTPVTPFTNLVGCPLNGAWSLTTVDQWASDDGHLVSWGIDFNPSILPNTVITYDPGLDSVWWTPDTPSTFINVDTNYVATVKPTTWDTTWEYTFNMVDSFGCHYDTAMSFFVRNPCDAQCLGNITPIMSQFPEACVGDSSGYAVAFPIDSISQGPFVFFWTNNLGDTISSSFGSYDQDTLYNVPTGMYTVNIIDSFGCTVSNNIFVGIVAPLNSVVSGIESTSCAGNFCDGEAFGGVISGGTAPYNYLWESGGLGQTDQKLCSGANSMIVTDARGCKDTVDFVVPQPDSITLQLLGEDTICISNVHNLQTVVNGGNGGYVYMWNNGIGNVDQVNVSPANTTNYQVTVTDSLNCPPASDQITLYVRNPLDAELQRTDTVCPGDEFSIHVEASGGDGIYSYQWSDGVNMGDSSVVIASKSQYVFVSVTDQCGTSPAAVDSVWVQVGGYKPIQVESLIDTICPNEPYILRPVTSGGKSPLQYSWDNSLGTVQIQAVAPSETTVYTVTVSDLCNSISGVGTFTLVVDGNDFEAVVDTAESCQPGEFVFSYETDRIDDKFFWNFGDGFSTVYANDSTSHSFSKAGCYDVQLRQVTALGCEFVKTYPCMVNVRRNPIADFDYSPSMPDIVNAQVQFTNLSSYADSYHWFIEDSLITESNHMVRMFSDSGDFIVMLAAENEFNCVDTIQKEVVVDYRTTVYIPSAFTPNNDGINDVFAPQGDGVLSYHLQIFDRWGSLIFESTDTEPAWDGTYELNGGQDAPVDIYIYQLDYVDIHKGTKSVKGEVQLIK